jgi:hypothetical protein
MHALFPLKKIQPIGRHTDMNTSLVGCDAMYIIIISEEPAASTLRTEEKTEQAN